MHLLAPVAAASVVQLLLVFAWLMQTGEAESASVEFSRVETSRDLSNAVFKRNRIRLQRMDARSRVRPRALFAKFFPNYKVREQARSGRVCERREALKRSRALGNVRSVRLDSIRAPFGSAHVRSHFSSSCTRNSKAAMAFIMNAIGTRKGRSAGSKRCGNSGSQHSGRSESEADECGERQPMHQRPRSVEILSRITRFSKAELQTMYRGFKQECPTGVCTQEAFIDIFAQFFPQGDSYHYAQQVFRTFDKSHSGQLTFEQFVTGLSVLARGSTEEKLGWIFELYDIDGDSKITPEEMWVILNAVYEMMGQYTEPPIEESSVRKHAESVFEKLDLNRDGVITKEEFFNACRDDAQLCSSLHNFDTLI